jgi:plastocyanin/uncharacterized membrane protein
MTPFRWGPFLATVLGAVLISLSLAIAASSAQASSPHNARVVVMQQMHFDPQRLSANVGDTVEWKNQDIFTHTVTANDGSFDSGPIKPGASWKTTMKSPGAVTYHCSPHPNMMAELSVASATEQQQPASSDNAGQGNHESLRWAPPHTPEEIHPILVNFTAALFPLAFLSDVLGRLFRRESLHNAACWMVLYCAAITPLTVAAGWWWKHAAASNIPPRLITVHQWLGTLAAILFIALAAWRWQIKRRAASPGLAYLLIAFVAVLALVYQGSLGGRMLFGH